MTIPALPSCFTQGETVDQSLERAKDAIAVYLEGESSECLRMAGVDLGAIVEIVDVVESTPLA